MNKHCFFTLLLMLLTWVTYGKKKESQPNIILIYVDDMGVGDASFTSGQVRPTPNIDRMASEGKVFTQYYTNMPVCSPSRVAVTTGMYPIRWNINTFLSTKKHNLECDQSDFLRAQAPTLARILKTVGYQTAHIGKWHMGGGRDVKDAPSIAEYGFDEFVSTYESPNPDPLLTSTNWIWAPTDSIKRWDRTAYFVDKTLEFLKNHQEGPCYVNLWPDDVHSPWVPDDESQDNWKQTAFTLPKLQPVITDFDREMGRLMDGIKNLGIDDNTLIIFTSDNGPAPTFDRVRTNGMRGCKNSLYEGGINMPFFVRWPGTIEAGEKDSQTVLSAVDLFPTVCEIAGAKLPGDYHFDGENVSDAILSGKVHQRKEPVFWEYGRMNKKVSSQEDKVNESLPLALRDGKWKCFSSYDGLQVELYDLEADPNETTNLADQSPKLVQEYRDAMLDWFKANDKSEIAK